MGGEWIVGYDCKYDIFFKCLLVHLNPKKLDESESWSRYDNIKIGIVGRVGGAPEIVIHNEAIRLFSASMCLFYCCYLKHTHRWEKEMNNSKLICKHNGRAKWENMVDREQN